jgi:hypothetical protein
MRYVHLKKCNPQWHHTYLGHVSTSFDGSAVGFSMVHIDSGRVPCRVLDSDPNDDYEGEIYCDEKGPRGGVGVQYFKRPLEANRV